MDLPTTFNIVEAVWWAVLSVVCWFKSQGLWRPVGRTAAILFLLFAVSDVIEVQTGAWWRPWWLAVLKGACIAGLISCGVWARRINRQSRSETISRGGQ